MRKFRLLLLFPVFLFAGLLAGLSADPVKVATFDIDATPPLGTMMAYDPVRKHDELSLRSRGIVILGAGEPIVLCAVDWIGISNEAQDVFRDSLAKAAGTVRERVAVHTLHQHDAPAADFTAEKIADELGLQGFDRLNGDFAREVIQRTADAVEKALPEAQPVTHYGWGEAEVEKIASNRRMLGEDGKVKEMRWTRATDPRLRAAPEGVIDPEVSLLSFWNQDEPVAVLSYYACHPQSYYRTGVPSSDFPGIARFIRGQGQPAALHVHFNGAGGNIGAGKYNDGDTENRIVLARRLAAGMRKAWTTTEKFPLPPEMVNWQVEALRLPPADHIDEAKLNIALRTGASDGFLTEIDKLAWVRRYQAGHAIDVGCLKIGKARVLHMPGELFVEYQLAAKAMRPDLKVAMAAYGEYGPGYIGTAIAYEEGGYETSPRASNVGPEAETLLMGTMQKLLGEPQVLNDFRIPPKSLEAALDSFETLDGFEMQLVAREPRVVEPVVLAYDEDGRMYVAEYLKFPTKDGISHEPDGRIRQLQDLDGDGFYEWSQVFANNLEWPTGICPWKGGVFVVASPDLWYFKDTDGDGEAEVREKVFTGFGFTNDEGTANNLIRGLDHWIYGAGSNSGGEIRSLAHPEAQPVSLRNRDFRFHPETLEFQAISGSEQFGNTFDDWGNRFICQNSKPAVQVVLPSHYLERNPFLSVSSVRADIWEGDEVYRASQPEPWRKARTKIRLAADRVYSPPFVAHDVFTGVAGITVYRGDAYPESFRGNLFIGEVQSNLVHRWKLEPSGAVFRAIRVDEETEILRSRDNWFRPANLANAPDGTLHIVDMHREFIETPDSLPEDILAKLDYSSGHEKGRIYRLAPRGFQAPPPPRLSSAPVRELVDSLESRNGWLRDTASRLLFERRDPSVIPLLRKVFTGSDFALARLHALYALAGLDALQVDDVRQALEDPSAGVRIHALKLAEGFLPSQNSLAARVLAAAEDPDPQVRFQAAFTIGETELPGTVDALLRIVEQSAGDPWIRSAVLSAPPDRALDLFQTALHISGVSRDLESFFVQLARILGARNIDSEIKAALGLIARQDATTAGKLITGLGQGQTAARSSLARFAESSPRTQTLLRELVAGAVATLKKKTKTNKRMDAIALLAHGDYAEVKSLLLSLLDNGESLTVQLAALRILSGFGKPETARLLVNAYPGLSPAIRSEVIETLLSREAWTLPLLEAMESGKINRGEMPPTRQKWLLEEAEPALRRKASRLFGEQTHPRSAVVENYRAALSLPGDPASGLQVFEENCTACHRHGHQGARVGPDMGTMQNRTPESLLIQILDPNREVQGSYVQYLVTLKDGSVTSGRIVAESPASLTLQRAGGVEEELLRQNIRSIQGSGASLMPEGLEQAISHQEMSDLLSFLLAQ